MHLREDCMSYDNLPAAWSFVMITAGHIPAQHVVARYTECGHSHFHVHLPVTCVRSQFLDHFESIFHALIAT